MSAVVNTELAVRLAVLEDIVEALRARMANFIAASKNRQSATNPAPIGPALSVTFNLPAAMSKRVSGIFRVSGMISGVDATVDENVNIQLVRNNVVFGPLVLTNSASPSQWFGTVPPFDDTPAPAQLPVTYGINAVAAHNLTVGAGQAEVTAQELAQQS